MKSSISPRIQTALAVTLKIHEGQKRKGDNLTPYAVHPISVALLLMNHSCGEDAVIAGLLHDALEDTDYGPKQIKDHFGAKVLKLVQAVSDKRPDDAWVARKNAYLKHLKKASKEACLIACADKINNLTSMIEAYKKQGNSLWKRFNASKEDKLVFYESVYIESRKRFKHSLIEELRMTLRRAGSLLK